MTRRWRSAPAVFFGSRRGRRRAVPHNRTPRLPLALRRVLARRPTLVPVLYAAGGIACGAGMLALDARVSDDQLPSWLLLNASSANAVVSGFGATLLFVVSVVYLVRISAVQLNAEPFSARVV